MFPNEGVDIIGIFGSVAVIGGVAVGYIPNAGLVKKILTGLFFVTLISLTLSIVYNSDFVIIFCLLYFVSLHFIVMSFIENRNIFLRILISLCVVIFLTSSLSLITLYLVGKVFI